MKALQQIRGKLRSSWRGSRTTTVTFRTKKRKAGLTLKPLHPGQLVRILDHHIKTWEPGTILREAREPQSYNGKNNTTEGVYTDKQDHTSGQTQQVPVHRVLHRFKYPEQSRDQHHHSGKWSHPQVQLVNHQETVQSLDLLQRSRCPQRQVAGAGPDLGRQWNHQIS